jgi:hypothetical protein
MNPTNSDVQAFKDRLAVYVGLKQTPEQIVVSLNNYFGKTGFRIDSSGWNGTVDIQYGIGDGNDMTFLATIGTLRPVWVQVPTSS